jgi:hypothetical protein
LKYRQAGLANFNGYSDYEFFLNSHRMLVAEVFFQKTGWCRRVDGT